MKKILVTGGAGFIGSHLVDALVEKGHQVRILDALVPQVHNGKVPGYLNKDAEFIHGDVCDADLVRKALDSVEVVFHQAAEVGVAQSMYEIVRYVKANNVGTATLLQEMSADPGRYQKLVVASSMSIYGEGAYRCGACEADRSGELRSDEELAASQWELLCRECGTELESIGTPESKPLNPTSIYAVSKQDQEQYCLSVGRAYKIPTVGLRYFNVFGTRQALSNPYTGVCAIFSSRLMNDKGPLIFEDGRQTRDFVHVNDIVQANIRAMERDEADFDALNVGSGRKLTIEDVARILAKGLGKSIEPEINGNYREGDIRHCIADIEKARELIGYEPEVKLEDGMEELFSWVAEQRPEDNVATASNELAERNLIK